MSGQQAYWRAQTRRYDRITLLLNRRFMEMASAAAESARGAGEGLEVAAGTGLITAGLSGAVEHLVATDASPDMLELLRGRVGTLGNVTAQEADALALDFADASFDVVLIGNLLHLLPEPGQALQEARRVLRPGGLLLAPTFCHGQGIVARSLSGLLALVGFPIVTRFKGRELDALVEVAGFRIQSARWFPGLLPIRFVAALLD